MQTVEVRTRCGWRKLAPSAEPPLVLERDNVELRGLAVGASVRFGRTPVVASGGYASVSFRDHVQLAGRVGLFEVHVDDTFVGEVEVRPEKISAEDFAVLRAELRETWSDLALRADSSARVAGTPPPPAELWRRIERPVHEALRDPLRRLEPILGVQRLDRARATRDLTRQVVGAGLRGRAARTASVAPRPSEPERQLVAQTLRRLRNLAITDSSAGGVVRAIDSALRHPLVKDPGSKLTRVSWGMRSDARYRRILSVHRLLDRPEFEAIDGPGELRLGVAALDKLYEYWVFLRVLLAAIERYGEPVTPLADAVSRRFGPRRELALAPGTEIAFRGDIVVVYEPTIVPSGKGWRGLEYVPHPEPSLRQSLATPDVAVLRLGAHPRLTIVDAKYVGRPFVEGDAFKMHAKYARIRLNGRPIVGHVVVAHPHEDKTEFWAGFGYATMRPGGTISDLPLPLA